MQQPSPSSSTFRQLMGAPRLLEIMQAIFPDADGVQESVMFFGKAARAGSVTPPQPTYKTVPAYGLSLLRDGIQLVARLEVLAHGVDDTGAKLKVNPAKLQAARQELARLWAPHHTHWYTSYGSYQQASRWLFQAVQP